MSDSDDLRRYVAELSDECLLEAYDLGEASHQREAWAAIVAELETRQLDPAAPTSVRPLAAAKRDPYPHRRGGGPAAAAWGHVSKLWRGDVPLVVTFWVWGMGSLVALQVAGSLIPTGYVASGLWANPLKWVLSLFCIYTWVCVWRSAGKYEGRLLWRYTARIWVALWIWSVLKFAWRSRW